MKKVIFTIGIASCLLFLDSKQAKAQKIYDAAGNHNLGSGYSGDGGLAVGAQLSNPSGIAFDAAGNQYIADGGNACVRMVNTAGIITTFAGNNASGSGYAGDGGAATDALLSNSITALVFDGAGNLYIGDYGNLAVRMVNTAGIISSYYGPMGSTIGVAAGVPVSGLAWLGSTSFGSTFFGCCKGGLFVGLADGSCGTNNQIALINLTSNSVSTVWGGATCNNMGDGGQANAAGFKNPSGIAFDAAGNLYIADMGNNRIRMVNGSTNIITNFAGSSAGTSGFGGDAGQATAAKLNQPSSISFDGNGNMYITDTHNYRVRKVNTAGVISTVAGTSSSGYNGDAITATTAQLFSPNDVACDASGNIYVADASNNEVREITSACIPPTIISQPRDTTVCPNSGAAFVVQFINNYSGTAGFQWQVNPFGTTNIINLSQLSYGSGVSMDTINNATIPMNGNVYDCIVKGCSNVTSLGATLHISYPNVTVNNASVCPGGTATLTASGADSYTWAPTFEMAATIVHTPTVTTSYTVSGTDAVTTCSASAVGTITLFQAPVPSLCMVTTDATSTNNVLYWDKTTLSKVDSFIIYREVSTGTYKRIGAQLYSDSSQFTDVARSVGPANGDPNVGTYRYKLSTVDSCGNESALGPYHNTVYFVSNGSGTFTWNLYSVESASVTPVTTFNLMRDDANTGVFHSIGSVAGNQTTLNDPFYSTYAATANWRVDAQGFNCTPTLRLANGNNGTMAAKVTSHSNQNNNRTSGINQLGMMNDELRIYPNPTTDMLNVECLMVNANSTLVMTDMIGNTVKQSTIKIGKTSIDVSDLAEGVYNISIISNERMLNKRVIITR